MRSLLELAVMFELELFMRQGNLLKDIDNCLGACYNGILLPKMFCPTVRKNCSSDREKNLKLEAKGQEFAKFFRSLEQFVRTVKGQNNFW